MHRYILALLPVAFLGACAEHGRWPWQNNASLACAPQQQAARLHQLTPAQHLAYGQQHQFAVYEAGNARCKPISNTLA